MKRTRLAQLMIFTVMCAALHGDATTGPCPLLLDRSLSPAGGIAVSSASSGSSVAHVYVGAGVVFKVVDVSEPVSPVVVGSLALSDISFSNFISTIIVREDFAYVWTWDGSLRVIDVQNPRDPREVGSLDGEDTSYFNDAAVSGGYAFVSSISYTAEYDPIPRLQIIDLGEPSAPIELASFDSAFSSLSISGSRLYGLSSDSTEPTWSIEIFDVSDAENPISLGSYQMSADESAYEIVTEGSFAYVSTSSGLAVIDASDPSAPAKVGTFDMPYRGTLAVVDGFVYAHASWFFDVIDVRDPSNPIGMGSCEVPYTYAHPSRLAVLGDHVFISHAYQGLVVVDVSLPSDPQMVMQLCEGSAHHVEVSGNYAYWIYQSFTGLSGMRISDLNRPRKANEVGRWVTEDQLRGVAVSGSHAYVAADLGRLLVIDISDPTEPREVGSFDSQWYRIVDHAVRDRHAYLFLGGSPRITILDVSDPSSPREVGSHRLARAETPAGLAMSGDYAYLTTKSSLIVIDVSDPSAPREVAHLKTPAGPISIAGPYAYIAADRYGLRVIDISEPSAPFEVETLGLFTWNPDELEPAISIAVSRRRAYIVTKYGGLHVIDVSDPREPHEIQFVPDFSGGNVAVSERYAVVAEGLGGSSIFDISGCTGRIYSARDGHREGDHRR